MGMFDYIRCDYPLPGNHPPNVADIDFQTKDTHAQYSEHYKISAQGQLLHEGVAEDFTGDIVFYHSNVVAYGPETYTRDGEDAIWLEYRAILSAAKLPTFNWCATKVSQRKKHGYGAESAKVQK